MPWTCRGQHQPSLDRAMAATLVELLGGGGVIASYQVSGLVWPPSRPDDQSRTPVVDWVSDGV